MTFCQLREGDGSIPEGDGSIPEGDGSIPERDGSIPAGTLHHLGLRLGQGVKHLQTDFKL